MLKIFDINFISGISIGAEYESYEGFFAVFIDVLFIRFMYARMTPEAAIELGFVE